MKVSDTITRNLAFVQNVYGCRRSRTGIARLMKNASDEELLCFVEICLNILRGRVPLRKRHLRSLYSHAHLLRSLARTRRAKSAKRLLTQEGSGLPALAGILASVLIPIVGEMIKKT